jgi:hypothetical protein
MSDQRKYEKPFFLNMDFSEPGFAVAGHTRRGSVPGNPRNTWVSPSTSDQNAPKT